MQIPLSNEWYFVRPNIQQFLVYLIYACGKPIVHYQRIKCLFHFSRKKEAKLLGHSPDAILANPLLLSILRKLAPDICCQGSSSPWMTR
jgi:hypothetical protein